MVVSSEFSDGGEANLRDSAWPSEDLEAVAVCPACRSGERKMLYEGLWDASFLAAPGRWTLWRCKRCVSAYLDPRPSSGSIGRAYKNYYTHAHAIVIDPPTGIMSYVKRALANGYRNWRYGGSLRPAIRLGAVIGVVLPSSREDIDYSFRYLPRPFADARLLDVGCGGGEWLVQAAASGWQACGVDIDRISVERARQRGLDVRAGSIDAWHDYAGSFSAITMNHVLEHVSEPKETLSSALRLLRPGGVLYIDTPNIDAPTHARFGRHWRGLETPRHLVLLSKGALDDLLIDVGFEDCSYHRAPGAAAYLVKESERMAKLDLHSAAEARAAERSSTSTASEFLTLTCKRPLH